ncbi:MAG TPA: SDR family oxidoreductase [Flavipsychrobacter sp.]|nr:SDR family oxidoreductase [Flavipsychrobacter sp.]
MYDLKDKIMVITGASSGIGKALALEALARGAKVALCARSIGKLQEIFREGSTILLCKADVSKEEDCKTFIDKTLQKFGRIDVLINNAGISMRALFDEVDLAVIKELMDINFWGAVYCAKYALPSVMEHKGVIASISSIAGYRGLPGRTGYSASKFAMQGFMEALRTELLNTGTSVLWFCPGFTASNIRNVARAADGSSQGETPLAESKLMSAETSARIMMDGIEQRKRNIVMTAQGKITVWLNKLLPGLADRLVYKHFLKEPGSPLQKYESI